MDDNDYVLAFDHFYTNNHIQILKSLLPFMEGERLGMLPALIKYMELKYTLALIKKGTKPVNGSIIGACSSEQDGMGAGGIGDNMERIYNTVHRYLAPNEEKMFSQLLSAMQTMKNMREMQQMMEMLQGLNPDADAGGDIPGGLDLTELMKLFGNDRNDLK